MEEKSSNSDFNVDAFLNEILPHQGDSKKAEKGGHDNVSVDEKKAPKIKREDMIKEGFSERDMLEAEMNVKFNKITKENFTEKIGDLQNFFSDHPEMLIGFKDKLAALLRAENNEFIKAQGILREKRLDDSFIMKGEIESLEEKYHKVGEKINLLSSIRNTFFK